MEKIKIRDEISAAVAIGLFYFIMEGLGVTCPILFLTGVSCAGCGMSRAWLSILRGDISLAVHYHPLFWMVIPMAILFILRNRISARARKWSVILIVALFAGVYLIRMFGNTDEIVYFRPDTGLIARGFTYMIHIFQEYL